MYICLTRPCFVAPGHEAARQTATRLRGLRVETLVGPSHDPVPMLMSKLGVKTSRTEGEVDLGAVK